MTVKRIAGICLAAMVSGLAFANGNADSGAPGKAANMVEITQLVWDRGTVPTGQGTVQDNWWTQYVNEKMAPLGIKVKFVPIPRAQETQKLPLMLAAGEAPDLCFTYDKNLLNLYVKNGALVDYTGLLQQYGQNILKLSSTDDLNAGKINGRQYTFIAKSNGVADTTFIRKDWLDALGLPIPTTPEEFYATMKAFKEKDPGNVGDKLVPFALQATADVSFSMWQSVLLTGFVKDPPSPEKLLTPPQLWPEAKACISYMNRMYNDKLLGEFIIDKDGALFKQKVIRGEIGAFVAYGHWPYHAAYGSVYEKLLQNNPNAKLVSINPWKQKDSKEVFINFIRNSPYLYQFFSPKSTKHPEAVMKYLNWLASEDGYKVATLGIPGKDYTIQDGVPVPIDVKAYADRIPWIEPQYMAFRKPFTNPGEELTYLKNTAKTFPAQLQEQYIAEGISFTKLKYTKPILNSTTPIADKFYLSLQKKWEEAMARMVIAPTNKFDASFDEAIKSYRAEGGDDVVNEAITMYREQTKN